MPDWIRKQGSTTAHPIEAVLQDRNGPIDLSAGSAATIRVKVPGEATVKIEDDATVVTPGALVGDTNRGRVRYIPQTDGLDVPGFYEVEWIADIPGIGPQVFPEDGYMYLLVLPTVTTI